MIPRKPIMRCHLCERTDVPEKEMNSTGAACLACERGYLSFRRAFKIEFGRWPTMKEFKEDDPTL